MNRCKGQGVLEYFILFAAVGMLTLVGLTNLDDRATGAIDGWFQQATGSINGIQVAEQPTNPGPGPGPGPDDGCDPGDTDIECQDPETDDPHDGGMDCDGKGEDDPECPEEGTGGDGGTI